MSTHQLCRAAGAKLRKAFPTLAGMEPVKWMFLPVVLLVWVAIIVSIANEVFMHFGFLRVQ